MRRMPAAGLVLLSLVLGGPGAATASATASTKTPDDTSSAVRLVFVSQTPWVTAGGQFALSARVDPGQSQGLEVVTSVFPAVATRSEFALTLAEQPRRLPIFISAPVTPDPTGVVAVDLGVQDPALPRDPARLRLGGRDGVHPVVMELRERDDGPVRDQLFTYLIHLPEAHPGPKLGVAMVLPVYSRPRWQPDGSRRPAEAARTSSTLEALDLARSLPVALAPNPETLDALASDAGETGTATLARLRQLASDHSLLGATYVPVSLPALLARGLDGEAASQLARGQASIEKTLRTSPDGRIWLTDQPVDASSLGLISRRGVDRLVVHEAGLAPVPGQQVTLTRPFQLASGPVRLRAVSADPGLAAHFTDGQQPLRAQQLLADLAVVYLDLPGDKRAVVALPPRTWAPNGPFLQALAVGLAGNPVVEAVGLETVFEGIEPARGASGAALVRRPVAVAVTDSLGDIEDQVRATRGRLDSLGSVLGPDNPLSAPLDEQLLVSQSADIASGRQRRSYVAAVDKAIDAALATIQMPQGRSITLTARRGSIPVTFQNRSGRPARVVVKMSSDKLVFPAGSTQTLELTRLNTTQRFPVVARTSGAFPIRIQLTSPDGKLVVGRARITVRSTAASGLGVGVSVGAALFLALWWGRHASRGRRARRLVSVADDTTPAGATMPTGEGLPAVERSEGGA